MYVILICCFIYSPRVAGADETPYANRIEIGIGTAGSRVRSRPEWTGKLYASAVMNCACRITHGLSVQGGQSLGYGYSPDPEWIKYGAHYQICTEEGTYKDSKWIGARYEIPLSVLKKDTFWIHSVYCSLGMTWDEYGIRSKSQKFYPTEYGWSSGETPEEKSLNQAYKTADLEGYYVVFAARWRLDTGETSLLGPIGPYGVDFGVKYTRYSDCKTKYDNIMDAKSNFNNYQIFISMFLKINLLY